MVQDTPTSTTFWLPKAGHRADEYEDAVAVSAGAFPAYAAIADGATESAFARRWAQLLVRGSVEAQVASASALAAQLPAWQTAWRTAVAERTTEAPWYAAAKAEEGAYAALLTLMVTADGRWRAVAVGDCCLLHLRGEALHAAWPLDDPDQFTHRPDLLASQPAAPRPPMREHEGAWQAGDALVLATDALAAWLLATDPTRALGWTDASFRDAVTAARDDGALRNDDVTALILALPAA
ncbi:MAG: hypothetical protein GVY18_17865 [Bacteroidetes bacterium]|jgi:hypothetical protein|nr:hypothetical protein [Bacteroidota bacterium]